MHYDSSNDRTFNCAVLYINTGNCRKQATIKTIAPAADLAMELAIKIVRADKRRKVKSVYYTTAIEQ
jgi:hypothetical protein